MSYQERLTRAGHDLELPWVKHVLDLLTLVDSKNLQSRHIIVDTFSRLARGENMPDARAYGWIDRYRETLCAWQQYALECFPRETFYEIPEPIRSLSSMWRYATYEQVITDVLNSGAIMAPTLLSLYYQPQIIVEFGVDAGWTSLLFSRLNPDAEVYGVDKRSRMNHAPLPVGYVPSMHGLANFHLSVMDSWKYVDCGVDMCLIDGEHVGDAPYKDSVRAWENRSLDRDWCIIWDDYNPSNPDVYEAVNRFIKEVGHELQTLHGWAWIGTKPITEAELKKQWS